MACRVVLLGFLVCAYGDWGVGRGNLRVAKTPPLQAALRGMPPTGVYAHVGLHGEGVEGDDDAARRVATSFEKRENRF